MSTLDQPTYQRIENARGELAVQIMRLRSGESDALGRGEKESARAFDAAAIAIEEASRMIRHLLAGSRK